MDLTGSPYELEPMAAHHVATVAAIERRIFTQPWSYSSFMHEVSDNPYSEYLVLRYRPYTEETAAPRSLSAMRRVLRSGEVDRSMLGYGGFWLMLDEAHICTLAVREAWRGRGLGELLLAALIERAYAREAAYISLEVRKSNLVAQNLYQKYGFDETGLRKGYYLDNREDGLIMTTAPIRSEAYRARYVRLTERLCDRLRGAEAPPPEGDDAGDGRRRELRR